MATVIAAILIITFLFLSGIHIYWALGGSWGKGAIIPTRSDNIKAMRPGVIPTLVVAFGLLSFAVVIFLKSIGLDFKTVFWHNLVHEYGLWIIAGIFILRAIGEFNYVGFFKKYNQTKFGQNDTKYYSPLCLVIGVLTILLELTK